MASIDNKIVSMEFNNAEFEKRIGTTMSSLEHLNKSIADVGTKNGLTTLADSAKGFNLAPMAASVDGISAKFLAMSAIAITAISNITNRVVDAGLRMASSFTVAPITQGFAEYELKMGSIQTIMAGSGASLDEVNKKLQELNAYSDQTIYSFGDMTSNIGKFTNAGVSLDQSVAAIQGVANVAALSGANAEEASRAMYNFGQALGAGSVKLMDWKSIELANMGTVEFKQQLIDAAVEVGTLTRGLDGFVRTSDDTIVNTQNFTTTLEQAWLNTEVLTGTLGDYADATTDIGARATEAATAVKTASQLMGTIKESIGSGWASTFEILIGNFEEAKELFTDINEAIGGFVGKNADARNELLQGWKDLGGRTDVIEGFKNIFETLGAVFGAVGKAFRAVFPPRTSGDLKRMSAAFLAFTEGIMPTEAVIKGIATIFKGFFSILSIGWTVLKEVGGLIGGLFADAGEGAGSAAFTAVTSFMDKVVDLKKALVDDGGIAEFFDLISAAIANPMFFLGMLQDRIQPFIDAITGAFDKIVEAVKNPLPHLETLWQKLSGFLKDPLPLIESLWSSIQGFFDKFTGLKLPDLELDLGFLDKIANIEAPEANGIGKFFGKIITGISDGLVLIITKTDEVTTFIKDFFGGIGETAQTAAESETYDTALETVATGLFGGLVLVLGRFLKNGITIDFGGVLSAVTDTLGGLTGVLKAMQKDIIAGAILKIAYAVAVLTASMLVLSFIDGEALKKALTAMAVGFAQLTAAFAILMKIPMGPTMLQMIALSVSLGILAGAVLVMAFAVRAMSGLGWEEMAKGLIGTAAAMTMLVQASKSMEPNLAGMFKTSGALLGLAFATEKLADSVKVFGEMDFAFMAQGLLGLSVAIGALIAGLRAMPKDLDKLGVGMLTLGVALNLIAMSVERFGNMEWEIMGKGLLGVAGALTAIAIGLKLMPKTMGVTGAQLLLVSLALIGLSGSLAVLAQLSWEEIGKGVIAIAGTMGVLAAAMLLMNGSLPGAAALVVIAFGLDKLAKVLDVFQNMSWSELIDGLLKLAVALGVIAGVSMLLSGAVVAIGLLGAGLALLGLGFAGIGFGVLQIAKAFKMFSTISEEGVENIKNILKALIGLIPTLIEGFAQGFIDMGIMILEAAPGLIDKLKVVISRFLIMITTLAPQFKDAFVAFMRVGLDAVTELYPDFVQAGYDILLAFLQGIADNIGEIVTVVAEIARNFMDAMSAEMPALKTSFVTFIQTMMTEAATALGEMAPFLLIGVGVAFVKGLWQGITDELPKLFELAVQICVDVINFIKTGFGIFSPSKVMQEIGVFLIEGFLMGIVEAAVAMYNWFKNLATSVLTAIGNLGSTLTQKGLDLLGGLYNAIIDKAEDLWDWLRALPEAIKTAIGSLFETLKSHGTNLIIGLKNAIVTKAEELWEWLGEIPGKIKGFFGDAYTMLSSVGKNIVIGLKNGIIEAWGGLTSWVSEKVNALKDMFTKPWEMLSPSKFTKRVGNYIVEGLAIGIRENDHAETEAQIMTDNMKSALEKGMAQMQAATDGINSAIDWTITPVLDLTELKRDAKTLTSLVPGNASYDAASSIASTRIETQDALDAGGRSVVFEQTINSPTQLSTADIYKQTRNQITIAKEELSIP